MTDAMSGLNTVNAEMAKQLSRCEDHLKLVVEEYRSFSGSAVFDALDQATRMQVEAAVRAYVDANAKRIRAAKAGLEALRGLGVAPSAPDLLDTDPLDLNAPATPPTRLQPTTRIGVADNTPGRQVPLAEAENEEIDPSQFVSVEDGDIAEDTPAAEPSRSEDIPAPEPPRPPRAPGRPAPKPSRGSAVPVDKSGGGFRRSDAESEGVAAGPGARRRIAPRKLAGGATIKSVSRGDMASEDGRMAAAQAGDVKPGDVVSDNRPRDPSEREGDDYDAIVAQVRGQQRQAAAAGPSVAEEFVLAEAEIVDETGNLIGRARGLGRHGKQLLVDQIEVYLDNMQEDMSDLVEADDSAAILKAIIKARKPWLFQGPEFSENASIAYANGWGFEAEDGSMLVLDDVGLALVAKAKAKTR